MEHHYRKYARRFYRFIRHPRRRNRSAVHRWLSQQIFDRRLWAPSRYPMIHGLSLGLGMSMLPIPIPQMPISALVCAWRKWNIPMAILGCWLSNPFTWFFQIAWQVKLGRWILGTEVPVAPMVDDSESGLRRMLDWAKDNAGAWSVGVILSAIICAAAGWVIGHLLWIFFGHYVKVSPIRRLVTRRVRVKAEKETEES